MAAGVTAVTEEAGDRTAVPAAPAMSAVPEVPAVPAVPLSGMACMLLAVLCFSGMAVCVKLLGQDMPAHEKIFVRTAVTIPVLLWMLRARGLSPLGNNRRLLLARGLLGFTGMLAYFASLSALPLGNAVLLTHCSPVFAALFASRWLGERAGRAAWIASALCLLGVALVAQPEPHAPLLASAIAFGSAIINGATYTVVRASAKSEHHLVVVLALVLVSLPVTAVLCAFDWVWPTGPQWWLLAAMSLCSIAAQIFMTMGMQRETASRATNTFFLGVVLAMVWGQWLGDPPLTATVLCGAALIVGSIVALTLRTGSARRGTRTGTGTLDGPGARPA
jgi:drug/metabolite transporter (DMT)-like permease